MERNRRTRKTYITTRKMYQQAENMKTTENINANCIEPQYEYQGLVSTIHPPDYWRNLGSSKSRDKTRRRSRENNYSGFAKISTIQFSSRIYRRLVFRQSWTLWIWCNYFPQRRRKRTQKSSFQQKLHSSCRNNCNQNCT